MYNKKVSKLKDFSVLLVFVICLIVIVTLDSVSIDESDKQLLMFYNFLIWSLFSFFLLATLLSIIHFFRNSSGEGNRIYIDGKDLVFPRRYWSLIPFSKKEVRIPLGQICKVELDRSNLEKFKFLTLRVETRDYNLYKVKDDETKLEELEILKKSILERIR